MQGSLVPSIAQLRRVSFSRQPMARIFIVSRWKVSVSSDSNMYNCFFGQLTNRAVDTTSKFNIFIGYFNSKSILYILWTFVSCSEYLWHLHGGRSAACRQARLLACPKRNASVHCSGANCPGRDFADDNCSAATAIEKHMAVDAAKWASKISKIQAQRTPGSGSVHGINLSSLPSLKAGMIISASSAKVFALHSSLQNQTFWIFPPSQLSCKYCNERLGNTCPLCGGLSHGVAWTG